MCIRDSLYTGKTYNSVENIKQFFSEKGAGASAPASRVPMAPPVPMAKKLVARKFGPGSTVEMEKYGRGTVVRIEGSGEDAKVTVSFPGHGLKKLVAKYAGIKVE